MSKAMLHFLMLSISPPDRQGDKKILREHQMVVNEFCQAVFEWGSDY